MHVIVLLLVLLAPIGVLGDASCFGRGNKTFTGVEYDTPANQTAAQITARGKRVFLTKLALYC